MCSPTSPSKVNLERKTRVIQRQKIESSVFQFRVRSRSNYRAKFCPESSPRVLSRVQSSLGRGLLAGLASPAVQTALPGRALCGTKWPTLRYKVAHSAVQSGPLCRAKRSAEQSERAFARVRLRSLAFARVRLRSLARSLACVRSRSLAFARSLARSLAFASVRLRSLAFACVRSLARLLARFPPSDSARPIPLSYPKETFLRLTKQSDASYRLKCGAILRR